MAWLHKPMTVGRVLVLDPDSPTALGAVRALGSAGWQVGVGTDSGLTAACASKWCSFRHDVPRPRDGLEMFVRAINRAVDERDYELVFGCGDAQVFALSRCREAIRAIVPFSDDATLLQAFDKLALTEIAEKAGLIVPRTLPASVPDARRLKPPVAVKPRWHWRPGSGAEERLPVSICQSIEEAFTMADRIQAAGAEPVIQEFHEGWLLSFNIVTDKNFRPLAMMQQKAHAIWPPQAGTPAHGVTMEIDKELAEGISRLLELLGWFGLVNLQFIVPEDGVPRLIDFNGRPYQTLALALGAGVNFVDIWARAATSRAVTLPGHAQTGVRYYDFSRELLRIRAMYGWHPLKLMKSFRFALGAKHIIWRADDLRPVLFHYVRLLSRHVKQRR